MKDSPFQTGTENVRTFSRFRRSGALCWRTPTKSGQSKSDRIDDVTVAVIKCEEASVGEEQEGARGRRNRRIKKERRKERKKELSLPPSPSNQRDLLGRL